MKRAMRPERYCDRRAMRATFHGRRLRLLSIFPLLAACYTYAPIEPAAIRAGTSVRARVSSTAADRLAALLGTTDARLITGTLIDNGPDTIIVEVPTVMRAEVGSSVQTLHQRVSISRGELLEIETRQLDRLRTGAMAGSAAVIVGAVVIKAMKGDPGTERPPGNGNSGEFRSPY
jgi:hypothetical protein